MARRPLARTREIDERAATMHGADRDQELYVRCLLDDVAGRAGQKGGLHGRLVIVHREHEHAGARLRSEPHQFPDGLRGADRDQELYVRCLLDDVAGRAGQKGGLHGRLVIVHREHEHAGARLRSEPHQFPDGLRGAGAGHREIQQHDVGRGRPGSPDRVGTVRGLAHHFHVRLGVDEQLQAGPQHGVVISDQHPDLWHSRYHGRTGKRPTTVVPSPVCDSTSTEPPNRAARSRIPFRPRRCRFPAAASELTARSRPMPSSCTRNKTAVSSRASRTLTRRARACFATLVSASCRTRYTVACSSGDRPSATSLSVRTSTAIPCSWAKASAWRVTAAASPRSSSTPGWSPRHSRPRSTRVWAVVSRSCCASSTACAAVWDPSIVRNPTSNAVSDCPVSSWSSRAIRRRSSSWAVTTCSINWVRSTSCRFVSLTSTTTPITPLTPASPGNRKRSEEHTSELQSLAYLVCRL